MTTIPELAWIGAILYPVFKWSIPVFIIRQVYINITTDKETDDDDDNDTE